MHEVRFGKLLEGCLQRSSRVPVDLDVMMWYSAIVESQQTSLSLDQVWGVDAPLP